MKNIIISFIVLLITIFVFFTYFNKSDSQIPHQTEYQYMGNKEYEKSVNDWLDEKEVKRKETIKKMTPEKMEKQKDYLNKVAVGSAKSIKNIIFYGKIIDQYGAPVEGATIKLHTGNSFLASGTGRGSISSDSNGMFTTSDIKGSSFSIDNILRTGYEFKTNQRFLFYDYKRFSESLLWTDYSDKNNPFVITMFKVEKYAKVNTNRPNDEAGYRFVPDGRTYTLDLLKDRKRKSEGINKGDLLITFNRTEEQWSLVIQAVDGGLQETTDLYTNVAPISGYEERIEYNFNKGENDELKKKFYFNSRNNNVFGNLELIIVPYNRTKSAIRLLFTANLERGRDLAITPHATF